MTSVRVKRDEALVIPLQCGGRVTIHPEQGGRRRRVVVIENERTAVISERRSTPDATPLGEVDQKPEEVPGGV